MVFRIIRKALKANWLSVLVRDELIIVITVVWK